MNEKRRSPKLDLWGIHTLRGMGGTKYWKCDQRGGYTIKKVKVKELKIGKSLRKSSWSMVLMAVEKLIIFKTEKKNLTSKTGLFNSY